MITSPDDERFETPSRGPEPGRTPPQADETRYVVYERDDRGAPYAVEVVNAPRWSDDFLVPPDVAAADTRVVHLSGGAPPSDRPYWLRVITPTEGKSTIYPEHRRPLTMSYRQMLGTASGGVLPGVLVLAPLS